MTILARLHLFFPVDSYLLSEFRTRYPSLPSLRRAHDLCAQGPYNIYGSRNNTQHADPDGTPRITNNRRCYQDHSYMRLDCYRLAYFSVECSINTDRVHFFSSQQAYEIPMPTSTDFKVSKSPPGLLSRHNYTKRRSCERQTPLTARREASSSRTDPGDKWSVCASALSKTNPSRGESNYKRRVSLPAFSSRNILVGTREKIIVLSNAAQIQRG
ncbi:uncharacterized protein K460DRAFT_169547 [Cucurbitaria berberidis CBS 394.84]|uniref:Uncharacterized protein n=1 Tax=Cucurbitaria berberidis CBS 394.84 TaxID=1168544 RepID=A0A9P4L4K0_9PLEO|nr:uncharacterized protein K460DRAFT_169547 [Cucurbitaria berberidis CBS 394.84]KAF1841580.1 hypothetical protein K460DRAFT_169547 [Cucurbitaria berberidis CBS 394.84]